MSVATKEAPVIPTTEGLEMLIPPRLLVRFEAVQRELKSSYGYAPDLPSLIRFWLACSTISQIRKEFEAAVLSTNENVIPSDDEGEPDGDDL